VHLGENTSDIDIGTLELNAVQDNNTKTTHEQVGLLDLLASPRGGQKRSVSTGKMTELLESESHGELDLPPEPRAKKQTFQFFRTVARKKEVQVETLQVKRLLEVKRPLKVETTLQLF
jgi:hypothetical protein